MKGKVQGELQTLQQKDKGNLRPFALIHSLLMGTRRERDTGEQTFKVKQETAKED